MYHMRALSLIHGRFLYISFDKAGGSIYLCSDAFYMGISVKHRKK